MVKRRDGGPRPGVPAYSEPRDGHGRRLYARTSRRLVALAAVSVIAIVSALGWWAWPRLWPARAASGASLGALPRGVGGNNLNLLVITLDTTRADKLGCYGEASLVTPNLDRLAGEGVQFDRALSPIPLTMPAHSTIFTGTLPPFHGVRDNGGFTLDARHETLARMLKRHGFATGAFVAAYVLDSRWGLDEGFDRYFDDFDVSKYSAIGLADVSRPASEVVDAALPWLEANAGRRFFAWVHFYDPHSPYEPPEPWKTQFARRPYLGEVAYMDSQVGRILDWLDERHLAERTIVVALGDHGESLGEHGEGTHGLFIYDVALHVPFLVRAPFGGLRHRRVPGIVRVQDVVPTILDLIGLPTPGEVQGRSLVPMLIGEKADLDLDAYAESFYARYHYGWSELRSIRAGRYKYIEAPRPELYDIEQDPNETTNLYADRRSLADRMAGELSRLEAAVTSPATSSANPAAVDPETRERLAALGYVGSFVDVPRKPGEQLADPKDKVGLYNLLLSAREAIGPEAGKVSVEMLEQVIAADPKIIDAWMMLGNELARRGTPDKAIDYYRKALELKPDYDLATINMANAYRQMGRFDAAIAGYDRYLRVDPRNGYVHYQVGELQLELGRLDAAAASFTRALELDRRLVSARNALGIVALRRGDDATAEREIRAALAEKPDVRLAHFNLALLAEKRGELQAAVTEYQKEIELHDDAYKAAFNLGRLYERAGDRNAQIGAYRRSIQMNRSFAEGYFYLAKLLYDLDRDLDEAARLARQGLEVGPHSEFAPLGHYVLADIFNRRGRRAEAEQEAAAGRALEARSLRATGRGPS